MTDTQTLALRTITSFKDISAHSWDACANPSALPADPFLTHAYLSALEQSGSATEKTGWQALHILVEDPQDNLLGCMPLYLKFHSRGEFIFDQGWAQAYEQAGGQYYPKLLSAVPFTPVPGRRFLLVDGERQNEVAALMIGHAIALCDKYQLSSLHINFIAPEQLPLFAHDDLLQRSGHQFHFENKGFKDFDDFLASLSSRKRKTIRKERRKAVEADLTIQQLTGQQITKEHWDIFYDFYTDTHERKWGSAYLTRTFFSMINQTLADQLLLVLAYRDGKAIAAALNFIGADTLYGRYWGASEYHPALHFELCYYQAIDFAIANNLKTVEAGAGGEHKLVRGYLPTPTHSAHYLPDPGFHNAVKNFLSSERRYIQMEHEALSELTPFRKGEVSQKRKTDMETKTYNIDGMTCSGCTSALEKKLLEDPGIEAASASHENDSCDVTLDPAKVSDERIAEITDKAGFEFKGTAG